jgi:hypothetical protein
MMFMPESDPTGKSAHDPGAKLDSGKNRLDLVLGGFARALDKVGWIGTNGANKYTDNGWMEVPNGIERYGSAMLRHYLAVKQGQEYDKISGELHYSHMAWNALAVLELTCREIELDYLLWTQRQRESTSMEEPNLSSFQPATKKETQDVGDSQSIPSQEKCTFPTWSEWKSKDILKEKPSSSTMPSSILGRCQQLASNFIGSLKKHF